MCPQGVEWGTHVTITHGAVDLTLQDTSPGSRGHFTWDPTAPIPVADGHQTWDTYLQSPSPGNPGHQAWNHLQVTSGGCHCRPDQTCSFEDTPQSDIWWWLLKLMWFYWNAFLCLCVYIIIDSETNFFPDLWIVLFSIYEVLNFRLHFVREKVCSLLGN